MCNTRSGPLTDPTRLNTARESEQNNLRQELWGFWHGRPGCEKLVDYEWAFKCQRGARSISFPKEELLDQPLARPEEVLNLRVEHMDLARGTLKIMDGKSKAARRTPVMTPNVKALLAARMTGRSQGWFFEGKKPGSRLNKLNNQHNAVVTKIGAEFVLYEFRHTFATRFGEAIGDPIALAAILGHANLRTVMKYRHTRESHTAKGMEKFIGIQFGTETAKAATVN